MLSTTLLAVIFIGQLIALIVLWALFLRLGLRWAKVPDVTTRRILLTTAIVIGLGVVFTILSRFATPSSVVQLIFLGLIQLAASVIVPCLVISKVFKARFRRAMQAWLPTLLATAVMVAIALLVVRPFLYEGFFIPTNAMAPTLVGNHRQAQCPQCGHQAYGSAMDRQYASPYQPQMICDNFHVTQESNLDELVHSGDRIAVAKFFTPQRWDMIVFQSPRDPESTFVKRLVGLPGEKIHIEDGAVWVNGKRQTPPDSIRGIEYLSEAHHRPELEPWGSADRPALLGDDEYFVLGDFSAQSHDSRFWRDGAPGHNLFAVPVSYLKGVVTHTYWPPHRWRIHR